MKLASILRHLAKPDEEQDPEQPFNLVEELHAYLITPDARQQRATGSFSPSQLGGCKRALAYNYLKAPVNDVHLEPRLILTFELGNHIHDRFQWMFEKMAKRKGWEFIPEMRIIRTLNPWFVSGRTDGMFKFKPSREKRLIEIKSIHKSGFDRLYDRPLPEHQEQGNTYQGLLHTSRIDYLYICKDNSQVKSFSVPFDRSLFNMTMRRIERILLRLQDYRLPKRITPDCRDPKCKFHEVCHSGKTVEDLLSHEAAQELEEWKPVILRGKLARGKAA